jgi:hypothetical protein
VPLPSPPCFPQNLLHAEVEAPQEGRRQSCRDPGRGKPVKPPGPKSALYMGLDDEQPVTDHVVMARDALRVQRWRGEDANASGAAAHLRGQRPWTA